MKTYTSAMPYFTHLQMRQILKHTHKMLKGEEHLSQGKSVSEFEEKFAHYCGVKYAIATSSCTAALEIIFAQLGLSQNDEVLVPTQTFFANASSVLRLGAKLRLMEVDEHFMLTKQHIQSALTPHTKALVIVHFAGLISPDIFEIKALCKQKGIVLIEDCSHAHGALARDSKGREYKAGSIGDVAAFSFFSTKILTCGEGGMIVSNDKDFAFACRARANRGIDSQHSGEHFISLSSNHRMASFNAIMGLVGLEALESNLTYRNKLAHTYMKQLQSLHTSGVVSFQSVPEGFYHSYWRFIVFLHKHKKTRILNMLREHHIYADAPYEPLLHKQKLLCLSPYKERVSLALGKPTPNNHISLPLHCALKIGDVRFIAQKLKEALV